MFEKLRKVGLAARNWADEHRTGLIVVGSVIVAAGAGYLGYRFFSETSTKSLLTASPMDISPIPEKTVELAESVTNVAVDKCNIIEFPRSGGKRVLPNGYKASMKQIELARINGIELAPNETYVSSCIVRKNVA